jgi:hypothetical protein
MNEVSSETQVIEECRKMKERERDIPFAPAVAAPFCIIEQAAGFQEKTETDSSGSWDWINRRLRTGFRGLRTPRIDFHFQSIRT